MDIRPLTRAEKQAYASRMAELLRENFARHPHNLDVPVADVTAWLRPIISDPKSIIIAALDDEKLVYFSTSRIVAAAHPFGHPVSVWLKSIGVKSSSALVSTYSAIDAAYQGQGIVPAAAKVHTAEIARQGYALRIIHIVVSDEADPDAPNGFRSQHTFYERIGYQPVPIEDVVTSEGKRLRYYFKRTNANA